MANLANILFVALGSALGGVCRYGVGVLTRPLFSGAFPWSTFIINMAGCLAIGLIYGLIDRGEAIGAHVRLFLIVGFCGGFTTFSTFAHENYLLFGPGRNALLVAAYAALSFFAGLLLVWAGHRIVCR